jgi:hypothetical protein
MYGSVFSAEECALPINAYPIKPTPISDVELKSTVHHYSRWLLVKLFWVGCVLVSLTLALPSTVAAEEAGPAAAIAAYTAALNAHDLPTALALFDQYGSATDIHGRHFEGSAALTEFLAQSGFTNPDAQITTTNLHVVANRAVWMYKCTCNEGATEVRLVINHDRISVFAIQAPPATVTRATPTTPPLTGVVAFLVLALGAGALSAHVLRSRPPASRKTAGQLLIALAAARPRDHALSVHADRTSGH